MNIPFTQTEYYLSWHQAVGTKTFYKEFFRSKLDTNDEVEFQADGESEKVRIAVVATVILKLRVGKILYCPYGPVFENDVTPKEKNKVFKYLKELGKSEGCFFVRVEGGAVKNAEHFSPPKKTYSKDGIFQPRTEWWLDLSETQDKIFERMNKDHRYSVRRAERENVEVEIIRKDLENYFDIFWNLLNETSERDGFILYEKEYYKQIFKNYHFDDIKKFLVFTKKDGVYLSVALVVISDKIANLVFAGSVSLKRELGFNHLMQWEAIKESILHRCEIYNFGGISENGYGKDTLKGVTNFKKKFGGYLKFHGVFKDLPINYLKYFSYILVKYFR